MKKLIELLKNGSLTEKLVCLFIIVLPFILFGIAFPFFVKYWYVIKQFLPYLIAASFILSQNLKKITEYYISLFIKF